MPSRTNEYAFETGRISSAFVESSSSVILDADPQRRYAAIYNLGTADCFLALGTPAESGKGILLKAAGGAFELHAQNLTHAEICAITSVEPTTLSIQEGF